MDTNSILEYMSQYGLIFLFVIVFLEYMNLPGFPAGVIMPVAGMWISGSEVGFIEALIISVFAGLLGSWVLYLIGRWGGDIVLKKYFKKFPSHKRHVDKYIDFIDKKGCIGIFVSKLIPMVRTIISIPAGVLKMDFIKYSIYSTLGILVWNGVLISIGYILGEKLLQYI